MPRPGPRMPKVAFRITQADFDQARAARWEVEGKTDSDVYRAIFHAGLEALSPTEKNDPADVPWGEIAQRGTE